MLYPPGMLYKKKIELGDHFNFCLAENANKGV
jgi:hypothetical protein